MRHTSLRARRHASRRAILSAINRVPQFCERLEPRRLLSISLFGLPNWIEQGPGPITGGGVTGMPLQNNAVAGAVQQAAIDPTNANRIFIASVNGGVWRTSTATYSRANGTDDDGDGAVDEAGEEPSWTPLTDQFSSTSMGAIAFSPLDATMNTVFAGMGRVSNGLGVGGPRFGVLRTTDGGNTWTPLGAATFGGINITKIVPTTNGTSLDDQVVLASTGNGIFRSPDGGDSWNQISGAFGTGLPNGGTRDLVADPANPGRFFTGVGSQGVYVSNNWGATWAPASTGLTLTNDGRDNDADGNTDEADETVALTDSFKFSVHNTVGNNVIYVGLVDGGSLSGVFRTTNGGTSWAEVGTVPGINPGTQGGGNFSIVADPTLPNIVFVGGDRGPGFQQRGDAFTNTWTIMLDGNTNGTRPHADSRNMYFDSNGDIIETSDGGIFRLVDPNTPATRRWETVAGNLRTVELNSVSYDRTNNSIFGGAQDNGSSEQDGGTTFTWRTIQGADGSITAVDHVTPPGSNVYHFVSSQFLGTLRRREVDNTNVQVSVVDLAKTVNGAGTNTLNQVEQALSTKQQNNNGTLQFVQPYLLNAVVPSRMLVGTGDLGAFDNASPTLNRGFIYESFDQGISFNALGGVSSDLTSDGIDNDNDGIVDDAGEVISTDGLDNDNDTFIDGADANGEFAPINSIGAITAFAYGGRLGGVDNPDVIYMASGTTLRLRSQLVAGDLTDFTTLGAYTGGSIVAIHLDPDDWQTAFIADTDDVYMTTNAGQSFTKITGNLQGLSSAAQLWSLDFARTALGDVLLAGGFGGVFRLVLTAADALWSEYGLKMPEVISRDITYDPVDDVLVAGTYGRGAWRITNASATLAVPGVLQIDGDTLFPGQDDKIRLVRDPNNPQMLQVFLNNISDVPDFTAPLGTITQINVNGLGGNDVLCVDSSNGLISVPNGIRYDGGSGDDELQLIQEGGDEQDTDIYSVGPGLGEGSSVIAGPTGTQTVFFENLEPVIDLVPAASLIVNATTDDNTINYVAGAVADNGLITIDEFESIEFSNKVELTINALAGTDLIHLRNGSTPTGLVLINVDGGDPTARVDQLLVNASSGSDAIEVDLFLPESLGSVDVDGALTVPVKAFLLGGLTIDGRGGGDDLTINTPSGADTINYVPGGSIDSGSVNVGSQLAIQFVQLGAGGSVTLDSAGASNDHLLYHGTALNDEFDVDGGGVITLNARLPLDTPGIGTATLQGFAGDDTFTLIPPIASSPFEILNFNGGESSAGDKAFFVGTAGDDTFSITGTSISQGGNTVNANGVEQEFLTALGGADTLHYTGVVAFNEQINIAATTLAGAGRLFVPGLMSLEFTNAELIDVSGNLADTDTLTFSGTNDADTIEIHTDAAGTAGNPVLKLANASAQTLLTLTNYLNIETLRVEALDGEDVINVFTGPTSGRSIFINGGLPTAKKKSTDRLNVFYVFPKPKIIHSTATQNPGSGLVDLIYPTARSLIQYVDMETVVVRKF